MYMLYFRQKDENKYLQNTEKKLTRNLRNSLYVPCTRNLSFDDEINKRLLIAGSRNYKVDSHHRIKFLVDLYLENLELAISC